MQLLYSLLISSADPCVHVQEQAEEAPESSITIYKNFSAVCVLSQACREDIIHWLFSAAEETEPFSDSSRSWASFIWFFPPDGHRVLGMVWVGRDLQHHLVPSPVCSRPGCCKLHPAWPWSSYPFTLSLQHSLISQGKFKLFPLIKQMPWKHFWTKQVRTEKV